MSCHAMRGCAAVPSSSVAIERVCDTLSNMGPPYCTTTAQRQGTAYKQRQDKGKGQHKGTGR